MIDSAGRAIRSRLALLGLLAAAALAAVFVFRYGLAAHELQLDEFDTVAAGRRFDSSFFHMLFSLSPVGRGPERLSALVFALPSAIFTDTATVFRASHVLFGLLYLSAAIPVYALARGLGLERWQAVLPAAGAILTPWLLFGGTLLNITLAYPTAMGLAWATWRSMVKAGWCNDLLVLLFALAGAMARESHALFALAAFVALSLATWTEAEAGQSLPAKLRSFPGRLARAHPLIVGAALAALLVVAVYGTHRLLGQAYQPTSSSHAVTLRLVLDSIWITAGELTVGTGLLPMIVAVPWLAHELVRPRRRESWSFAIVAITMFVAFIVMVVYFAATTSGAADDERYTAVLAGLPPLAAAVSLFRRELKPLWVAVSGVLLTRIVVTQVLYLATGPYDYFLAPARLFFTIVVQGQLSSRLPFDDHHIATTLMLGAAAIAVGVALILTRRSGALVRLGSLVCVLALAGPIAISAASGIYDGDHFETLATFPTLTFEQQAFVDSATKSKSVAVWDYAPAGDLRIPYEANQAAFFNRSVDATLHLKSMDPTTDVGRNILATVNWRSGALSVSSSLPEYLLVPLRFTRIGFFGKAVTAPATVLGPIPFSLVRLDQRARVAYVVKGAEDEGWIPSPRHTALIRLYPTKTPACWQTNILAPTVAAHPIHYHVSGPGLHQDGVLAASSVAPIHLHSPEKAPALVRITITGAGKLASGAAVSAGLYTFIPESCGS